MRCSALGGAPYQWPCAPVMRRATKASARPAASGSFNAAPAGPPQGRRRPPGGQRAQRAWGLSMPEVAHASEDHGDAALVCRDYDLVVAHRSAWLDHARGADVDHDVEPVAKRKEG